MADIKSGPGWSDAQWELIGRTVTEAFDKSNVAGKFLPCYGPLPESAEYVRAEKLQDLGDSVSVSDDKTLKLFTLTVKVPLSREQIADESLSTALLAFRRAAVLLAQVEDDVVFNGFKTADNDALRARIEARKEAMKKDPKHKGPTDAERREEMVANVVTSWPEEGLNGLVPEQENPPIIPPKDQGDRSESLIRAVSSAIGELEGLAHPGPFASILGNERFDDAHTPSKNSMVLPADRIKPLLKGPLLRSGQMKDDVGIVVSLAGTDIDLVVATPPRVQFLQLTENAKYLFRVYEKFTMRIKSSGAVERLKLKKL